MIYKITIAELCIVCYTKYNTDKSGQISQVRTAAPHLAGAAETGQ